MSSSSARLKKELETAQTAVEEFASRLLSESSLPDLPKAMLLESVLGVAGRLEAMQDAVSYVEQGAVVSKEAVSVSLDEESVVWVLGKDSGEWLRTKAKHLKEQQEFRLDLDDSSLFCFTGEMLAHAHTK